VVAVFMVYISALIGARDAIARGSLAPWPGMWTVHIAFLLAAAYVVGWPALRWRRSLQS
jgi:lipopolysaccharide export LptBFGC system permease protein LptF